MRYLEIQIDVVVTYETTGSLCAIFLVTISGTILFNISCVFPLNSPIKQISFGDVFCLLYFIIHFDSLTVSWWRNCRIDSLSTQKIININFSITKCFFLIRLYYSNDCHNQMFKTKLLKQWNVLKVIYKLSSYFTFGKNVKRS